MPGGALDCETLHEKFGEFLGGRFNPLAYKCVSHQEAGEYVIFFSPALWQNVPNGLAPGHDLHEREVAKLLFVSRYRPLALFDHVLDRLEDAWVRLTDFLNLCMGSEKSANINPKWAAIGQSVRVQLQ